MKSKDFSFSYGQLVNLKITQQLLKLLHYDIGQSSNNFFRKRKKCELKFDDLLFYKDKDLLTKEGKEKIRIRFWKDPVREKRLSFRSLQSIVHLQNL